LKDKNDLSKTFSQWLTITNYHPSTIIRADTIFCNSQEEFEDTKRAIRNRIFNTTSATSGAGTADPSGEPEFTPGF
jgi:hypothetical protein